MCGFVLAECIRNAEGPVRSPPTHFLSRGVLDE